MEDEEEQLAKEKLLEIVAERLKQTPKKTLRSVLLKMVENQGLSLNELQEKHGIPLMILTNKKLSRSSYVYYIKDLLCKKYKLKINS